MLAQSRMILLSSDSEAEEDMGPLSVMKRWFTGRKSGCASNPTLYACCFRPARQPTFPVNYPTAEHARRCSQVC